MILPQSDPTSECGTGSLRGPLVSSVYSDLASKIMSKTCLSLLCAAAAALAAPASAGVVGRDAAACVAGKPSVQVHVSGFKRGSTVSS
jgi:hypothetical protein